MNNPLYDTTSDSSGSPPLGGGPGHDFLTDGVNFYVWDWVDPRTGEPSEIEFDPNVNTLNLIPNAYGIESIDEVKAFKVNDGESEFGSIHIFIDGQLVVKLNLTAEVPAFTDPMSYLNIAIWDPNAPAGGESFAMTEDPDGAFVFGDGGDVTPPPSDLTDGVRGDPVPTNTGGGDPIPEVGPTNPSDPEDFAI